MAVQIVQRLTSRPAYAASAQNGSIWNHFGHMGLISGSGQLANYDQAFYFVISKQEQYSSPGSVEFAQRLVLPVNPEEIVVPQSRSSSTIDVVGGDQRVQIGTRQLKQVELSGMFPAAYDPDYCVTITGNRLERTPADCRKWVEDRMKENEPVYLLMVAMDSPTGDAQTLEKMPAYITGFAYSYRAGHPLDLFYDLQLTEYRPVQLISQVYTGKTPSVPPKTPKSDSYTTKKGDTLAKIARSKDVYGSQYAIKGGKFLKSKNPNLKTTRNKRVTTVRQKLKPGQKVSTPAFTTTTRPNISTITG